MRLYAPGGDPRPNLFRAGPEEEVRAAPRARRKAETSVKAGWLQIEREVLDKAEQLAERHGTQPHSQDAREV